MTQRFGVNVANNLKCLPVSVGVEHPEPIPEVSRQPSLNVLFLGPIAHTAIREAIGRCGHYWAGETRHGIRE